MALEQEWSINCLVNKQGYQGTLYACQQNIIQLSMAMVGHCKHRPCVHVDLDS